MLECEGVYSDLPLEPGLGTAVCIFNKSPPHIYMYGGKLRRRVSPYGSVLVQHCA